MSSLKEGLLWSGTQKDSEISGPWLRVYAEALEEWSAVVCVILNPE